VGLADEAIEVLDRAEIDLRAREERLDADVDGEAALDAADDRTLDGLVLLDSLGDLVPCAHEIRLLLGELEQAVFFAHLVEVDVNNVSHLDRELALIIDELGLLDGAFGLVADVHGDQLIADPDDRALDHALFADGLVVEELVEEVLEVVGADLVEGGIEIDRHVRD
jgi:hypothetical protein